MYKPTLEFSFSSVAENISESNLNISNYFLYSKFLNKVCQGGLFDEKFGSLEKICCKVCLKCIKICPGHFGYIKLYLPVFNIGYLNSIQTILNIMCKGCSRLLITSRKKKIKMLNILKNENSNKDSNFMRCIINIIQDATVRKKCFYCNSKNGIVKRLGYFNFIHDMTFWLNYNSQYKKQVENRLLYACVINLNPLKVFHMFQKLKIEDLVFLNMEQVNSRPENLILTYIPVPPLTLRPNIFITENSSNEDNLTTKLSNIQYFNLQLKYFLLTGINVKRLSENWNILQIEIARYLNSTIFLDKTDSKVQIGLYQRIKGKKGRFRGNLSGKRVDFSGRTVISPDPEMNLNSVGIPFQIAIKLTFSEKVNKANLDRLQRNVYRGPYKHPGANVILDSNGNKILIQKESIFFKKKKIKEGVRVERHLKNNDIILFNRQPSLHRVSIMAHRVKIIFNKTFQLNSCSCKPYNADFDGDEMNIHIPQTQKARCESIVLLNLTSNMITSRNGELQIAPSQDLISLSFLLTSKDQFFSIETILFFFDFSITESIKKIPIPSIIKPLQLWTGKQVFSLILYNNNLSYFKSYQNKFYLFNMNIFQSTENLYSLTKKQCSPFVCPYDGWILIKKGELLSGRIGKTTIGSGEKFSFFCNLANSYPFSFITRCMTSYTQISLKWLREYGFSIGTNDVTPNHTLYDKKKKMIIHTHNICQFIKRVLSKKNAEVKLHVVLNLVRETMGKHCLDITNLVNNSGLTMVASGSKGSVVNLVQMISCIGQQSVKGVHITCSIFGKILPISMCNVLEFSSEDNGFIKTGFQQGLDSKYFFLHTIAGREGLIDTAVKTSETGYIQRRLVKFLEDVVCSYDLSIRTSDGKLVQFRTEESVINCTKEYHSYNIDLVFLDNLLKTTSFIVISLSFFEIDSLVKASYFYDIEDIFYYDIILNLFYFFYTSYFFKYNSCFIKIDLIFQKISKIFLLHSIVPGDPVGAEAGQNIGEPGTQLTLQTFHLAGISNNGITTGVPRINEIINASKTINIPVIKINLIALRKKYILQIKKILNSLSLSKICQTFKIFLKFNCIKCTATLKSHLVTIISKFINLIEIRKKITNTQFKLKFILKKVKNKIKFYFYNLMLFYRFTHFTLIKIIDFCKNNLITIVIKKISNFEKIIVTRSHDLCIFSKSINLLHFMQLNFIDMTKIYSNHLFIVVKIFGIEAVRLTIKVEIEIVFRAYGITINKKHLSLLSDLMTFQGRLIGITRYGLIKIKSNTFVLASFEKTIENLFLSAIQNSSDEILGVSDNIILGKEIPIGTGLVSLQHNFYI